MKLSAVADLASIRNGTAGFGILELQAISMRQLAPAAALQFARQVLDKWQNLIIIRLAFQYRNAAPRRQ
jgi:hypothetical protein